MRVLFCVLGKCFFSSVIHWECPARVATAEPSGDGHRRAFGDFQKRGGGFNRQDKCECQGFTETEGGTERALARLLG